jgi:hypothetical protein
MQRRSAAIRRINLMIFVFVAGVVGLNRLMGYGLPGEDLIRQAVEIRAEFDAYNSQLTAYAHQMDGFDMEETKK